MPYVIAWHNKDTVVRHSLLILCLIIGIQDCLAASPQLLERERDLTHLFDYPCRKFGIPKPLAMAIARQESGMYPLILNIAGKDVRPTTVQEALQLAARAEARKLSYDVGVMQINSYWIRKYKIPIHILLSPKDNTYMGCWILRQEIQRHGMTWKAVGRYHSPTDWRAANYARLIKCHLLDILKVR